MDLIFIAGYMLLSGRVRRPEECAVIQEVLTKHLKRKVEHSMLFTLSEKTSPTTCDILKAREAFKDSYNI